MFPWDHKRSKRSICTCGKMICNFKVLWLEKYFHIRNMRLKHTCRTAVRSRKVTTEYLAHRYLEDWISDHGCHMSKDLVREF